MPIRLQRITLGALVVIGAVQAQQTPNRTALFGDLHIHTTYSFDAFMGGGQVRTTPDDAYRYAKGEPIPIASGEMLRISGPPLDFLAVSDHAAYLGAHANLLDPDSPTYGHPDGDRLMPRGTRTMSLVRNIEIVRQLISEDSPLFGRASIGATWKKTIEAAERHNDPGKFTALIGYEYTTTPGNRHLHRNVIFRGANVPSHPFSSRDSPDPEDLWTWLDNLREQGIEGLAIPHNMNQSDGIAFPDETWQGKAFTKAFAEKRIRNEPIVEMTQQKGTSEVHPSLSPNDEWANFEIVRYYLNRADNTDPVDEFRGGYWRDALLRGLEMQEKRGFNPYEFGAIGSSDSHLSAGWYQEDNRSVTRIGAPRRGSAYPANKDNWEGFVTPRTATHSSGGLAGVWAEENTRASIYDAMRRRETFATSGPRIRVRFFGGLGLAGELAVTKDPVPTADANGVPMGGELSKAQGAPSFLVWALRDPDSGWLQRAQVVKGWVENGKAHDQVFDVACSDGLEPDANTHRCPDNGAQVNLADCSISRDKGAVQLETVWTDPDFDPSQRAFYYLRVLENPTCRWSTWDAIRLGIEPNPDIPSTLQERAWSSPIWYKPTE